MLIRFVVENFKSFKEETEFNLLTDDSDAHSDHIHHTKEGIAVLPISVIYGGNASGKTNLVEAIYTAQQIILKGTFSKDSSFPLNDCKYAFDVESKHKPVKFEFEFIIKNGIYAYGLVIDYKEVVEEWLYFKPYEGKDSLLFERVQQDVKFGYQLTSDKDYEIFLKNEVRGLRHNQLFLTESNRREVGGNGYFDFAYDWFKNTLQVVFPHSILDNLTYLTHKKVNFTNDLLKISNIDTSIKIQDVNFEVIKSNYPDLKKIITEDNVHEKGTVITRGNVKYYIYFNAELGKYKAFKIISIHDHEDKTAQTSFEIFQESDGTRRLIELSPNIYSSIYKDTVLIIDEIDRSMHPLLSKKIIELFLEKRKGKGQLICTTHEDVLLDKNLLRPDEIWFVQRKDQGYSVMYPLSEFELWEEIDFQTGYLNGRFGAIPNIESNNNNLNAITSNAKEK